MTKIILLVLGLLFAYWVLKRYRRKVDRDATSQRTVSEEDMVRCAQCGVHLPRGESVATHGNFYCSAEHQRLHQQSD
ncbi:MAG: PP0621 family protein [Pseudomonadota bacterium]